MEGLSKEDQELLAKERVNAFRCYHIRTLAHVRKLIKANRAKEALKYLDTEIYNTTKIENKVFGLLLDAVTLKLKINEEKDDDKTNSGT
jgi:uncharacterized protein YaaW (UPF0174 family)